MTNHLGEYNSKKTIFDEMYQGSQYPMKDTDPDYNIDIIFQSLIAVCEQYLGYTPDADKNILKEAYHFITRNFMTLGANEIPVAFECAVMKKFEFDMSKHRKLSISLVADVLNAYSKYRNILLMEKLSKVKNENVKSWDEIDKRNLQTRIYAMATINDAKQLLEDTGEAKYTTYDEIPMYFGKILQEFGKVDHPKEIKQQLWDKAKKDALRQISSGRNSFNEYAAESARRQTKNILAGIESQDFKQSSERKYSQLYVWYYITGFVN